MPLLSPTETRALLSFNWDFLPAVRRTTSFLPHSSVNLMEIQGYIYSVSLKTTLRAPSSLMQSGVVGCEELL